MRMKGLSHVPATGPWHKVAGGPLLENGHTVTCQLTRQVESISTPTVRSAFSSEETGESWGQRRGWESGVGVGGEQGVGTKTL